MDPPTFMFSFDLIVAVRGFSILKINICKKKNYTYLFYDILLFTHITLKNLNDSEFKLKIKQKKHLTPF